MKKHVFDSLMAFYTDCAINRVQSVDYGKMLLRDRPDWVGLSYTDVLKYKYSYPIGVEKLRNFKEVEIKKDIRVKFYNQFDGFDIDVDRLHDNLDFLIDTKKIRNRPKTIDIYINVGESWVVGYNELLNKTYAAVKIIDHLETLGIRCAVYALSCYKPAYSEYINLSEKEELIEVCLKNHSDTLNLGAICTGISPWMFRYWMLMWMVANHKGVKSKNGVCYPVTIPVGELTGIIIDKGQCLNLTDANKLIENIKVA
jgi:hypothetical protein